MSERVRSSIERALRKEERRGGFMKIFVKVLTCIVVGYLFGSISPSYILSRVNGKDLREEGSGNLGATNTYLHLGKMWGVMVLILDLAKTLVAMEVMIRVFAELRLAGVITGCATIIGHMFPFYLDFKGGKGLACLAATMMRLDFPFFLFMLTTSLILITVVNWGVASAFYASIAFPVWYSVKMRSLACFFIMAVTSACILWKHKGNLKKIQEGEELSVKDFFKKHQKE